MGLKTWFLENKLQSVERRLKVLRTELKHQRKKLEELDTSRERGEIKEEDYRASRAIMEDHKARLVRDIHDAEAKERALRSELKELLTPA